MIGLILTAAGKTLVGLFAVQLAGIPLLFIIPVLRFRRQLGGFLARRTGSVR